MTFPVLQTDLASWTDEKVVERVLAGHTDAFEVIMRRYNQRLYRVALGITGNPAEAEDVMQDAYVRAFEHLAQFEGRARFSTWLTRIAVYEALARVRRNKKTESLDELGYADVRLKMATSLPNPEQLANRRQTSDLVEAALLALPAAYRTIMMLRDVQEMSTAEAAEVLDISQENLKVRLSRARSAFRQQVFSLAGHNARQAFAFEAPRCDRVVHAVFSRIRKHVSVHEFESKGAI